LLQQANGAPGGADRGSDAGPSSSSSSQTQQRELLLLQQQAQQMQQLQAQHQQLGQLQLQQQQRQQLNPQHPQQQQQQLAPGTGSLLEAPGVTEQALSELLSSHFARHHPDNEVCVTLCCCNS
jgi:hypothetical protein